MSRTPCTFRIDPDIKAEFQENCKAGGYTMGIMIEVMMEKYNKRQRYYRNIKKNYEQKNARDRLAEVKKRLPQ
jgi:hypothetical protein